MSLVVVNERKSTEVRERRSWDLGNLSAERGLLLSRKGEDQGSRRIKHTNNRTEGNKERKG